jgi:hypothetical protein
VCDLEVGDNKHAADVVPPSTALAFLTIMSETHKSTSSGVIQVKNWHKTIITEEKLDVISQHEQLRSVDIRHNVGS